MYRLISAILVVVLSSCETSSDFSLEGGCLSLPEGIKINQIQVLGTHNSYAKPIDPNVVAMLDPVFNNLGEEYLDNMSEEQLTAFRENHPNPVSWKESLSYNHPDFKDQLNAGLRSLEIDVYYDPTGDRFSRPAAYKILKERGINDLLPFDSSAMKKPGFKVFHMADIDFRSHYPLFRDALDELRNWSNKNPQHTPIFIMVEAKDMHIPLLPGSAEILPFTSEVYDQLDDLVINTLGRDKVITPDDVRGDYLTLEEAILANNWPDVKSSLGKFIFLLLPGSAGIAEEDVYVDGHSSLKGRVMFVRSKMGRPHAAFLLMDNAIVRKDSIKRAVELGYLVRTRSDIETYEARVNDYSRAEAAFSSGAQVISTDFYKPGNAYGTSYRVQLPDGEIVRVNPINYRQVD